MLARSQFYVAGRREKTRLGAWSRSSGNMELCCPLAPAAYQVSRCVGLDVEALPLGIPPVGDGVRTQSRYDLAKDLFHPRQAGESKLAEILLFHHAQGRTQGVIAFADELRSAGHSVHTPDLFDGRIFDDIETGMRFVRELGFAEVLERGEKAAQRLPTDLVYAGFSLGVVPAQKLTQTRPGSRGALFFHSCLPVSEFSSPWPKSVPVQIHGMDGDPFFVDEGDIDAARALLEEAEDAEMFLYPGQQHLFADSSLSSYDAEAAQLLTERVLGFLARL